MDFFRHQEKARRRTLLLVALFVLALLCIVALVDLVVLVAFSGDSPQTWAVAPERHGDILVWTSLLTLCGILFVSQVRIFQLRDGGGAIARAVGGVRIDAATSDPLRRRYYNVVEEIAIASGVPVPEIYVLEREAGINAFAAGYTPADAAVAVTRGALETLGRGELQGVVAHEFGHILNGDMRLNIRLIGWLAGIFVIARLGELLLRAGAGGDRDSRRGLPAFFVAGLGLLVVGSVGLFFGRLIKAAVSRQREYLADASAVQFTREPQGLAGALKKIGALDVGSDLHASTEEISHMLFAPGASGFLLDTHPPLLKRIRAIEPDFQPVELTALAARLQREARARALRPPSEVRPVEAAPGVSPAPAPLSAPALLAAMGNPTPRQMGAAAELLRQIPPVLRRAAELSEWAPVLVCYLLIDDDPELRECQCLMVGEAFGEAAERSLVALLKDAPQLNATLRIPLLEVCFPALRRLPLEQVVALQNVVERLIRADDRVTLFEFALARLLARQVHDLRYPIAARVEGTRRLRQVAAAVIDVLGFLAYRGQPQPEAARFTLEAGLRELGVDASKSQRIGVDWFRADWLEYGWSTRLSEALERLDELRLRDKERLLKAMLAIIRADALVTADEYELLRAICGALRLPLPLAIDVSG